MDQPHESQTETAVEQAVAPHETHVWESTQLFGTQREILIRHQGETYRLRQTRNGRLILQK